MRHNVYAHYVRGPTKARLIKFRKINSKDTLVEIMAGLEKPLSRKQGLGRVRSQPHVMG